MRQPAARQMEAAFQTLADLERAQRATSIRYVTHTGARCEQPTCRGPNLKTPHGDRPERGTGLVVALERTSDCASDAIRLRASSSAQRTSGPGMGENDAESCAERWVRDLRREV